jgi:hypothetical protein
LELESHDDVASVVRSYGGEESCVSGSMGSLRQQQEEEEELRVLADALRDTVQKGLRALAVAAAEVAVEPQAAFHVKVRNSEGQEL